MAYWEAGQKRVVREQDERLTELFLTVRDAYISAHKGSYIPDYVKPAKPPKGLRQLVHDSGGVVRNKAEFRN